MNQSNFSFCANTEGSGCYLLGHETFYTRPMQISNIFHRSFFGNFEDFILGILCAIILVFLSNIFHAILYRQRFGGARTFLYIQIAVLEEVVMHLRSPFGARAPLKLSEQQDNDTIVDDLDDDDLDVNSRLSITAYLLTILSALALLSIELLAVFITQPFNQYADKKYNLRAVQPVFATPENEVKINPYALSSSNMPVIDETSRGDNRQFFISVNFGTLFEGFTPHRAIQGADFFSISSYYHRAGSDHLINFGKNNSFTNFGFQQTRLQLSLDGTTWMIMFDEVPMNETRKLSHMFHRRFMDSFIFSSCMSLPHTNRSACTAEIESIETVSEEDVEQSVELYLLNNTIAQTENVTGFQTTFRADGKSMKSLAEFGKKSMLIQGNAAVFEEENRPGKYLDLTTGIVQSSLRGLYIEKGRKAGVITLCIVLIGTLLALIILSILLHPVSPDRIAYNVLISNGYCARSETTDNTTENDKETEM